MIYIGVDPGASGGIVHVDDSGLLLDWTKMPDTEADLLAFLLSTGHYNTSHRRAVMEKVHGGIGGRQGASGMFNYGRNYGSLLMALTASRIPFDLVPPQTWQKHMGVSYPKEATQTERKNISKRRAQQLFPAATVTHAIADAMLLADFCRRIHVGALRGGSANGQTKDSEAVRQQPTAPGARQDAQLLEELARASKEEWISEAGEELTAKQRRAIRAHEEVPDRTTIATLARHGRGPRP